MPVRFQIVIDCREAAPLARFWLEALGYVLEPPPSGFDSWDDYYRNLGVGEEDLGIGPDSLVDPTGNGPRIWFHQVPEPKTVKNRLHFDIGAGGGRAVPLAQRKERVEVEAARLAALGAERLETDDDEGHGRYAVAMADPEGNEFDIA